MDLVLIGVGIALIATGLYGQRFIRRERRSDDPDRNDRRYGVAHSICTGAIVAGACGIAIAVVRAIL